ncbi:hypothetical protein U1Q18_000076 [Sarracenia purpurea var. burkii]
MEHKRERCSTNGYQRGLAASPRVWLIQGQAIETQHPSAVPHHRFSIDNERMPEFEWPRVGGDDVDLILHVEETNPSLNKSGTSVRKQKSQIKEVFMKQVKFKEEAMLEPRVESTLGKQRSDENPEDKRIQGHTLGLPKATEN